MEESQVAGSLRPHSQSPLQASPSQQANLAQQLQSMPQLVQGLNSQLGILNGSNIEAFLNQNIKKGQAGQNTGRGSPANDQLLQLMLQQQQ